MNESNNFTGCDAHGTPKLTQELVDRAIALKRDGLSNGDIICAPGIHESMFYRWIGDPKNKL